MTLGKWAVIDIETTGIDPLNDQIIDLGYLQFEGTKLIKKYSSLVRYEPTHGGELSYFIQKLTNITPSMLKKAPRWTQVENDLLELEGHALIAHNAAFEEKFLQKFFKQNNYKDTAEKTSFLDSIPFLSLLFLEKSSLNLESFITDFGLKEKEDHRGYEDSLDLLKVLLLSVFKLRQNQADYQTLMHLGEKYQMADDWFFRFFALSENELMEIATSIDFNPQNFLAKMVETKSVKAKAKSDFKIEFSGKNISDIFREENKIKEKVSHYRFRESQENFALRVGQSFKNSIHALIQAPTGTGKTLGYLLPSFLFSHDEDKQVLVATGTKTLQAQAMQKDVPQTMELLGFDHETFKVVELVGSSNHLCELIFRNKEGELELGDVDELRQKNFAKLYFDWFFYFNQTHEQKNRLTRLSIPYVLKKNFETLRELEQELKVDYRACTGNNCPLKGQCSYLQGLREAKEAKVIIGNHALMFNWPKSFPRPSYIVVDEAHKLEGEATSVFTLEASKEQLEAFYKSLVNMQGLGALFYLLSKDEDHDFKDKIIEMRERAQSLVNQMAEVLTQLSLLMESYFKKMPRYSGTFWNELPMISSRGLKDQLAASLYNQLEKLKNCYQDFAQLVAPYVNLYDPKKLVEANDQVAFARFESFFSQLMDIADALGAAFVEDEEYTRSLKYHEDEGYLISTAPINVGKKVQEGLLNTSSSVVFTSATLANASGDVGIRGIEWLTGYTYLPPEKRFKSGFYLPPVYDYENKAKVFLVADHKPFSHAQFIPDMIKMCTPIIKELGGKTLFLFSSRLRFQEATELILREFEGKLPVFVQGMGHNIVEEYKKSDGGILIGMESFGEGIDIPGDSLQLILIDKIPDLRQDLIIKERREFFERSFGNEFNNYFQATRARSLHQKLGRLLRTEADRGSVIIFDSRVKDWKTNTLKNFIELMKPYNLEQASFKEACDSALNFIKKG